MSEDIMIDNRAEKLKEIKFLLSTTEDKLVLLAGELNWDYKKLLKDASTMVTCSINSQHRMPFNSLKTHEPKCFLYSKGYTNSEKTFPECSGIGSFITLTPESLSSITKNASLPTEAKPLKTIPQSSENFDLNFGREEKLAIYDYVIANTKKQKSYPDLWLQPAEKSEEKREKAAWEIAAAERDAKRRRASYRNKVHTNHKTHTEILREVIEAQMEVFKGDKVNEKLELSGPQTIYIKYSQESRESSDKRRCHDTSDRQSKEDRNKRHNRNTDNHSKHRERKRSPLDAGNDIKFRSRFHEKHRKSKTYEGRSHSYRSNHTHRK